jgi:hypothetical protein
MTQIQAENGAARLAFSKQLFDEEVAMQQELLSLTFDLRGASGEALMESLQNSFNERVALEEQLTERVSEQERLRLEARLASVNQSIDAARFQAETEIALRQMVTSTAMGLLGALGNEHRGAAIALLVWQKAIAIKEILINAAKAKAMINAYYEVAIANALSWGPLGLPWVAALEARRAASLAKVSAGSGIAVGLVAAEGIVEAAQLSNRGTQATLGTTANPVNVTGSAATAAQRTAGEREKVTQIIFQGDMYGFDDYVRNRIVGAIREAVDESDVVIVGPNSRQARMLGAV